MNQRTDHLLAGTGRRCINPPPGIAHGGWGAQRHEQAEGIDMDLWVTALSLSDGATTALILDVDIQILTNARADQIRAAVGDATGVPVANIRAAATHTHSGPVPYQSWIEKGYELVEPWFENVARWSAEAATEAISQLRPVTMRAGRGECLINSNRRCAAPDGGRFLGINREGPCDHEVLVVQLDAATTLESEGRAMRVPIREEESGTRAAPLSKSGGPVATLVNFACHPTIMGHPNRLITPDYPGAMKRVVEQTVGGRCLFLQGAAGDQGPVRGFQGDPNVYRNLGAILGHEVAKVALGLDQIPSREALREIVPSGAPLGIYDSEFSTPPSLPLRIAEREISVPLRDELPDRHTAAEQLDLCKTRLKEARDQYDEIAVGEAIVRARRADIQLRMAEDFGGRSSTGVRAHFVAFGDVALAGCNVEPFCETGLEIKRTSPFAFTLFGGYTNGRLAYLPTPGEWANGGYEVENSPFGQSAAGVLQAEIIETLRRLHRGG